MSTTFLQRAGALLLLLLALVLGAFWQAQAQAHQQIDVGAPLDDGYLRGFHAREHNESGLTFRWAEPTSELRFWAPPNTSALLTLRLLAPLPVDGVQQVALKVEGRPLAVLEVSNEPRTYEVLVPPGRGDLTVRSTSEPLIVADDPRELAFVLTDAALEALAIDPRLLLAQLWSPPFILPGLLLLAASALLLRPLSLSTGVLPLAALLLVAALGALLPAARMMLAAYLTAAALVVFVALGMARGLQRVTLLAPADDRRATRLLVLVFVTVTVATFAPRISSDGVQYYAYLRSLTMDGDLSFENDYRLSPFPHTPDPDTYRTSTGMQANPFAIGPAIVWGPLYGAGHLIALAGRALGAPWQANGFDQPYVVLTTFTSVLAGLVVILVGYRICRRWVEPPVAALAALAALLGTHLLFYTMREGSFAHAVSAATTSLYLLAWLRLEEHPSRGRWAVLGLAAGAMVLMYWISALTLVAPALTFVRLLIAALRAPTGQRSRMLGELLSGAALAAALLLLVFTPQLLAWNTIYGSLVTAPQGTDYIRPRVPRIAELLFSHLHGLLPWSPAFFAGLAGVPLMWRRDRYLALGLFLPVAIYLWYNASLWQWHGGGGFGGRRLLVLAPWVVVGLALLLDALRRRAPGTPVALVALMVVWQVLLIIRYDWFLIPHDPGELGRMPAAAFYLSRDAIPLWGLSDWLQNTYVAHQLRAASTLAGAFELLATAAVMVAATAAVTAVCSYRGGHRAGRPRPPRETHLQRGL